MFIKEIKKKNPGYEKEFVSHRLVESYRTPKGPRQRTILNLGKLDLPKEQWKALANQIEAEITGQKSLYPVDDSIIKLAKHYAQLIIKKKLVQPKTEAQEEKGTDKAEHETIDLNSITDSKSRTLGAEYVGLSTFKKLGLDALLLQLGVSQKQVALAALSVVGKLVRPASEHRTRRWARNLSALDELLGTDFSQLSQNALYRISDLLFAHKDSIEEHLAKKEKDLFALEEKIILYDLTNTYFEGRATTNKKAKHGRSKEKRSDCPLLTIGLVIDEMGFPKRSQIFQGNVSEPETLKQVIKGLQGLPGTKESALSAQGEQKEHGKQGDAESKTKKGITVVLDAGIASADNLTLLEAEGYDYVVVARNQPVALSEIDQDDLLTIKKDQNNKVEAQLIKQDGEHILYCKSSLKAQKEQSMKHLFQQRFEYDLKQVAAALSKKGGTKKYDKVLKRIGRLQQKYAAIARYYDIEITRKGDLATAISYKFIKQEKAEQRFSGSYFLRTSRTDLNEEEIWSLYVMLTNVEDAFRSLKSELALRPIYHQKEQRADAHLFITVLAYHLLNTIQTQLRSHDIHMQWWNIREQLTSHVRTTTAMTTKDGRRIHLRKSTQPEPFHKRIYDALGLSCYPLNSKRVDF